MLTYTKSRNLANISSKAGFDKSGQILDLPELDPESGMSLILTKLAIQLFNRITFIKISIGFYQIHFLLESDDIQCDTGMYFYHSQKSNLELKCQPGLLQAEMGTYNMNQRITIISLNLQVITL